MVVSFLPLLLVLLSYAHILTSVLRINSQEGCPKAFSTCSSHLLVVGTYYSSIAIAYVAYSADLPLDFHVMDNVVHVFFFFLFLFFFFLFLSFSFSFFFFFFLL